MPEQLALPTVGDADFWGQLLDLIRDIVRLRGAKEVAYALDISPSELANGLAERDRHGVKLRYLPYFLRARATDDLPRLIVEYCGLSLGEPRPLTVAERLERLEVAVRSSGAAGQAILEEAYGRRRR